jgi:hypothetical protein
MRSGKDEVREIYRQKRAKYDTYMYEPYPRVYLPKVVSTEHTGVSNNVTPHLV